MPAKAKPPLDMSAGAGIPISADGMTEKARKRNQEFIETAIAEFREHFAAFKARKVTQKQLDAVEKHYNSKKTRMRPDYYKVFEMILVGMSIEDVETYYDIMPGGLSKESLRFDVMLQFVIRQAKLQQRFTVRRAGYHAHMALLDAGNQQITSLTLQNEVGYETKRKVTGDVNINGKLDMGGLPSAAELAGELVRQISGRKEGAAGVMEGVLPARPLLPAGLCIDNGQNTYNEEPDPEPDNMA